MGIEQQAQLIVFPHLMLLPHLVGTTVAVAASTCIGNYAVASFPAVSLLLQYRCCGYYCSYCYQWWGKC